MAFLAIAPTGTVLPFAGTTAPDGWLICDGTEKSRTTYAKLFAVIADTYGVGDGSTTFNVPDMRGVFPRGSGTNGTADYGGVIGHTPTGGSLAAKGGQKTAKNGLSSTSSSSSVSGTTNVGHTHGSSSVSTQFYSNYDNFSGTGGEWYGSTSAGNYNRTRSGTAAGQSLGTTNRTLDSGSASAQAITVASADSETAPASLSLNYIIKL